MVTEKGLWQTTEAGKSWTKMPRVPAQIFRVYFKDEKNGWAVGARKTVLETHDGGQQWTRVAAAAEQPGKAETSAYGWIAFATPQLGVITGWNRPPEQTFPPALPEWIDPRGGLAPSRMAASRRSSWRRTTAARPGSPLPLRYSARLRASVSDRQALGLGLVEYSDSFQYPSEVYRIKWPTGGSEMVYRDKNFAVTDVWVTPDGTGYLSGIVVAGELRSLVPGRVRVLKSRDFSTWTDIEVDYRAVANRTTLAAAGDHDIWLATDNGMILKLTQ